MADRTADSERSHEANRLYWETDDSVNGIAEALGISKGRLYDLIEPLATELVCPDCGGGLAFPNRTARDRGLVVCDVCGFEGDRDELEEPADASVSLPRLEDGVPIGSAALLAGALVGAAAGVLLFRWMRR